MEQTRSAGTSGVLRQACEEIARELFASAIACGEQPDPSFSPSFEREIKRLISRTRNNRYHRLTRGAKVILVAAIIALLMVLTATASQIFGFTLLQGDGFFEIVLNRSLSEQNNPELECGYIPEGFVLTDQFQDDYQISYDYKDASDREIRIEKISFYDEFTVDTDRHTWSNQIYNDITYLVGKGITSDSTNMIQWIDPETKCFYHIVGWGVDVETIIEVAKQVK